MFHIEISVQVQEASVQDAASRPGENEETAFECRSTSICCL